MIDNSEIKVKSLQKALEILNLFADKPVLGVTEISEYFGIYKSTVHNILSTLPQRRPGWRKNRKQRWARMPRKRKRNTWNASSMHRESPCVRARPPTSAKATTSGYSVSCRSSGRTGLRCRSMWTVCWSSTSANTRK